ncbi:MAG: type II toxin-antitoxin system Phd/YefM family antitoxin [Pseudomonadota bacterium]
MAAVPDQPLSTAQARDNFAEVLNRAAYAKGRVVLTRRGKPLVAVVPIEDATLLEELEDRRDAEEIRARLEAWEREGRPDISLEDDARAHGIGLPRASK